jgi:hypothetical protein
MPMEDPPTEHRPMLAYATPEVPAAAGDPFLMPMRDWRRYTAWGLLAAIVGVVVWWPAALVAMAFVLVACVMTLITMTRYAAHNAGTAYAVRHLALAIALMPVMLLGIFLVSRLVQADIERWHLTAQRPPT